MQFKWALFYICLLVLFGCSNPKPDHDSQRSHNEVLILPDSLDNVKAKSKKVVLKSIKLGGKELEAPIVLPLKSPTVSKLKGNVNVLGPSQERKLGEPLLKKISPKLISNIKPGMATLGTPQEIICQTANTSEKAFSNLKFYNQDNGLVSTIVQSMVFDRMGHLWVGTDGGLCRFDGHKWMVYNTGQNLRHNYIFCLRLLKDGRLLIGTDGGGLQILNTVTNQLEIYNKNNGLTGDFIISTYELEDGKLFIGTSGDGLNIIDFKNHSIQQITIDNGLGENTVLGIAPLEPGVFCIGTYGGGLNILDFNTSTTKIHSTLNGLSNNKIMCLGIINKEVYMGTDGNGLEVYNPKTNSIKNISVEQNLSDATIYSMYVQNDSKLLIGTNLGGINIIDLKASTIETYGTEEGLSNPTVYSINQTMDGKYLIGTYGGGLNILDLVNQNIKHYDSERGISYNTIMNLKFTDTDNLVLATDGGGINYLDFKNGKSLIYNTESGFPVDVAYGLHLVNDNKWLVGSSGKGLFVVERDKNKITQFGIKQGFGSGFVWSVIQCSDGNYLAGNEGNGLVFVNQNHDSIHKLNTLNGLNSDLILNVNEIEKGVFSIATSDKGLTIYDKNKGTLSEFTTDNGLNNITVNTQCLNSKGQLLIGTNGGGLNVIDFKLNRIYYYTEKCGLPNEQVISIFEDTLGCLWLGTGKGLCKMIPEGNYYKLEKNYDKKDGLRYMDFNPNSMSTSHSGELWSGIGSVLTKLEPYLKINKDALPTYITDVMVNEQNLDWLDKKSLEKLSTSFSYDSTTSTIYHLPIGLKVPYAYNHLTFKFTGIQIGAESEKVVYSYKLTGEDMGWSLPVTKMEVDYRNISAGTHTFMLKSRSANGVWSHPVEFQFEILPPWYNTTWSYFLYAIVFVGSIYGFSTYRNRQLKYRQKQLEMKIDEATLEIKQQKSLIEEKHKEITDSINYASRIQKSFLATEEHLKTYLKEYFIFFKPKDIVSGDFYWSATLPNGNFVFVTADSTGHGVPGAIMSLLNITSLEKAIETETSAHKILNLARSIIIDRLKKDGSSEGGKDGMDCSLCVFDFKQMKLSVAAAHNPVWVVRNKQLIEIKPDKMPVGKHEFQDREFTLHEMEIQKGDLIYTLSDGFPDQFGGAKGKKFMTKNLRQLIVNNSSLSLAEQKTVLEKSLSEWAGQMEQVDDITIVGIKI
ncbi:MAG: SpoIIE family protein phosphatase [Bacteroidia bacterium]|nr:SpoIIE family protein phosphatase [Bacteroidia bacterium]